MICQVLGCEEHFACRLRAKGVQLSPQATPNRRAVRRDPGPRQADPAWERGIVTEDRPGGFKMPLLEPGTRAPLHVKQYGEHRRDIDAQVKRLKTMEQPLVLRDPTPVASPTCL